MPAGASEDFLFCAVEVDSLLLLLLLLTPIQPTCSTFTNHDVASTVLLPVGEVGEVLSMQLTKTTSYLNSGARMRLAISL